MGLGIPPPLKIKNPLEPSPLKSRFVVREVTEWKTAGERERERENKDHVIVLLSFHLTVCSTC